MQAGKSAYLACSFTYLLVTQYPPYDHLKYFIFSEEISTENETKNKQHIEMKDPVCITLEYYRYGNRISVGGITTPKFDLLDMRLSLIIVYNHSLYSIDERGTGWKSR